jgi:hypothetical protein
MSTNIPSLSIITDELQIPNIWADCVDKRVRSTTDTYGGSSFGSFFYGHYYTQEAQPPLPVGVSPTFANGCVSWKTTVIADIHPKKWTDPSMKDSVEYKGKVYDYANSLFYNCRASLGSKARPVFKPVIIYRNYLEWLGTERAGSLPVWIFSPAPEGLARYNLWTLQWVRYYGFMSNAHPGMMETLADSTAYAGLVNTCGRPQAADIIEAFRALNPNFSSDESVTMLPNFLWELRDMKSLVRFFMSSLLGAVPGIGAVIIGSFITFNFAIKPFLSDLEALFDGFDAFDARIKEWNSLAGKVMHLDKKMYSFKGDYAGEPLVHSAYMGSCSTVVNGTGICEAKAHAYIRPNKVTETQIFRKKMEGLGLNRPYAVLWEGLPFSWLIDYIINVSDMIDQVERELIFTFDVLDAGISVKEETVVTATNQITLDGPTTYAHCTRTKSRYERRRVDVALAASMMSAPLGFEASWPSPYQFAITAAVGSQVLR